MNIDEICFSELIIDTFILSRLESSHVLAAKRFLCWEIVLCSSHSSSYFLSSSPGTTEKQTTLFISNDCLVYAMEINRKFTWNWWGILWRFSLCHLFPQLVIDTHILFLNTSSIFWGQYIFRLQTKSKQTISSTLGSSYFPCFGK